MSFNPYEIDCFVFEKYEYDESKSTAYFYYSLDDKYHFCEEFYFQNAPSIESEKQRVALMRSLKYLHLAVGVSYYKTAVPKNIRIETGLLSAKTARFFSKLYRNGLAEFTYVNKLPLIAEDLFIPDKSAHIVALPYTKNKRIVVPIGGGKDSLVTIKLLKDNDEKFRGFYIGDNPLIDEMSKKLNLDLIKVKRKISENLFELNNHGAYNGHVPLSAIIAFASLVSGIIYGFDTVVISNERSANVGSIFPDGKEVNHQYSKSFEFENDFRDLINEEIITHFDYFSLLRPLSELMIGKIFAGFVEYHKLFISCNKAYTLNNKRDSWCLNCAKCRFVFLSLAPFLSKSLLIEIFGKNLLDEAQQLNGYKELVGHGLPKPFECVGEIQESLVAIEMLSNKKDWKDDLVIKYFIDELPTLLESTKENIEEVMSPVKSNNIPDRFKEILYAVCE